MSEPPNKRRVPKSQPMVHFSVGGQPRQGHSNVQGQLPSDGRTVLSEAIRSTFRSSAPAPQAPYAPYSGSYPASSPLNNVSRVSHLAASPVPEGAIYPAQSLPQPLTMQPDPLRPRASAPSTIAHNGAALSPYPGILPGTSPIAHPSVSGVNLPDFQGDMWQLPASSPVLRTSAFNMPHAHAPREPRASVQAAGAVQSMLNTRRQQSYYSTQGERALLPVQSNLSAPPLPVPTSTPILDELRGQDFRNSISPAPFPQAGPSRQPIPLPFSRHPTGIPQEPCSMFDEILNAKEANLRDSRALRETLANVTARVAANPAEYGVLWTGPGCARVRASSRYPRHAEDLDHLLDEASSIDEAYYHTVRTAFGHFLHSVYEAAVRHESAIECRLLRHGSFRPVTVGEVEMQFRHVAALFGRARQAGIDRFRNFVKNLKWIEVSPGRVRRGSLSREQGLIMRCWFCAHFENPYPTNEEKDALVQRTGLAIPQVNNWFINARVRHWNPCISTLEVSAKARQMAEDLVRDRKRNARIFAQGGRAGAIATHGRLVMDR